MRVLWLCNIMLPIVAEYLNKEASNKEGWLTGLSDTILERQQKNEIELGVAFPVPSDLAGMRKELEAGQGKLVCYGFEEDCTKPEVYDSRLEESLKSITEDFRPDVVHCFGTEYPHTLAMTRAFGRPDRILIGIQGLCGVYADAYMANLPSFVQKRSTLRDWLKKDGLLRQQDKFRLRGQWEKEAIRRAGHVTGRTPWDKSFAQQWNPKAEYHFMNETLRSNFYEDKWERQACEPYSIFLSQGDYPIKGLHYALLALPIICRKYREAKIYVAGNSIVKQETLKDRLKLSSYGKFLLELIREYHLEEKIIFLGKLNAEAMKRQYLKSHLFLCPSSIENSPNSVGEAMLLGMPVVTADVGGIRGMFEDGKDGIMYRGFRPDTEQEQEQEGTAPCVEQAKELAEAVLRMWSDEERQAQYCENARAHALMTHNGEANYRRLLEIYQEIQG